MARKGDQAPTIAEWRRAYLGLGFQYWFETSAGAHVPLAGRKAIVAIVAAEVERLRREDETNGDNTTT